MRLTLRTLLAYRDGVLSPTETGDLHQRIKKNAFASNLLRRIESLVKHKQVLAPKVSGEGLGADANSVAEYLDDTLTSEQVPEFERICIAESDLVLAELAHCHQLLAEALNSQVVVPQSLKALAVSLTNPQNQAALSRRLKIGRPKTSASTGPDGNIRRVDDSHPDSLVVATEVQANEENAAQRSQVQAPMVTSGGGSIKPQGLDLERPQLAHEVPEYLVGQRSGGWQIPLAIGAMVALLGVLVWQALGPLKNVRDLFVATNVASNDSVSKEAKENEQNNKENSVEPNSEVGKLNGRNSKDENASSVLDSSPSNSQLDNPSKETANNSEAIEPIVDVLKQPDAPNVEPTPPKTDAAVNKVFWIPGTGDTKSVLFVRQSIDEKALLKRIVANEPIPSDAEIVVPPAMRPTLNLAGRSLWTICGPTQMQLSQNENVTINTSLCRALTKAGPQGRNVTIVAPTGSVELQFEDATSMAAVEVAFRSVSHGPLTDKLVFKPLLIIVAVEGQVTVTAIRESSDSKSVRLVVGEGLAFMDGQPIEFELGAIPAWYRAGNDRPLDTFAAADMDKLIGVTDDDVLAQLTALCTDRRPETAALSIQAKMLLGDWGEFASEFLNNELMHSHWSTTLELAEQLIAFKDQNAEALRTAFEAAHPGRGDALFKLLAGASDSSQPKELLPKLVESLGSSELDERVLAAHQLRRLTGKDLGFQPNLPNRAVLQQWRRAISSSPALLLPVNPLWEAKKSTAG